MLKKYFLQITIIILGILCSCTSRQIITQQIFFSQYLKYNLKEKIIYFREAQNKILHSEQEKIFREALSDNDTIVLEALKAVTRLKFTNYGILCQNIMWNQYNLQIRLEILNIFATIGIQSATVPILIKFITDVDWLIREKVYQLLREFRQEQKNKEYYKYILLQLKEKNPQVLREVIKTLKWYKNKNREVLNHLYQRSFSYETPLELVIIIKELGNYKNRLIFNRLKKLARNHKSYLVREEAKKQLRGDI